MSRDQELLVITTTNKVKSSFVFCPNSEIRGHCIHSSGDVTVKLKTLTYDLHVFFFVIKSCLVGQIQIYFIS